MVIFIGGLFLRIDVSCEAASIFDRSPRVARRRGRCGWRDTSPTMREDAAPAMSEPPRHPRHRRCRLHRLARLRAPVAAGPHGGRLRQLQRLLRPGAEACPREPACSNPRGVRCEQVELADAASVRTLFDARRSRAIVIHLAAQAGVRYSITHPRAVHPVQPGGLCQHPRGLPAPRGAAPRLRQLEQRVRRPRRPAVQRVAAHRLAGVVVRRDQEGQRVDGTRLQPSVRPARHRAALLHGLWPVGPTRHGVLQLRAEDLRAPAVAGVRPWHLAARLHLHRRHRRGRGAPRRRARRSRARPRTRSSTSATTSR